MEKGLISVLLLPFVVITLFTILSFPANFSKTDYLFEIEKLGFLRTTLENSTDKLIESTIKSNAFLLNCNEELITIEVNTKLQEFFNSFKTLYPEFTFDFYIFDNFSNLNLPITSLSKYSKVTLKDIYSNDSITNIYNFSFAGNRLRTVSIIGKIKSKKFQTQFKILGGYNLDISVPECIKSFKE